MEICRSNLNNQARGVTMLELAIGIGIMVLLTFLAAPSFTMLRRNVALGNASRELQSALRLAQTKAFAAQGGATVTHSIKIQTDRYIIFGGPQPQTILLPRGITVSGGAGQVISFARLTGLPSSAQDIVLSAGSTHEIVRIESSGLISLP
jgi:Tfp pilus assembly protein FimT